MAIFLNFLPTSNHFHPLQVENCDSNSRLVVDEDDDINSGLKGLRTLDVGMTAYNSLCHVQFITHGEYFFQKFVK